MHPIELSLTQSTKQVVDTLTLRPFVAGPHNLPLITDPDEACADPALAALSAIMHPTGTGIGAALGALSTALRGVPDVLACPLTDIIAVGVRDHPARHVRKELVRQTVLEEVQDRGRTERASGFRREHVLLVLEQRGLHVSGDVRRRITECGDHDVLRRRLVRCHRAHSRRDLRRRVRRPRLTPAPR